MRTAAYHTAMEWTRDPFDSQTQQAVVELLEKNPEQVEECFGSTLAFGTGGLRGLMGIGTNRLNVYTIRKTTKGLAEYLKKAFPSLQHPRIVIAFDSRHHSQEFAKHAAEVCIAYGLEVFLCKELRPTPFLSFACRHLQAQAAIMITASHNPKEYNGYKVYWQEGSQVVYPHDVGIMKEIQSIPDFSLPSSPHTGTLHIVGKEIDAAYIQAISSLPLFPKDNQTVGDKIKIAYTSLHGTGITLVPQALESWGFSSLFLVQEQIVPDGDFPTTPFPNPECKEALALGIQVLEQNGCDLLLATDPDADRLGVAVMHQGKAHIITGNAVACLCAEHLCKYAPVDHKAIITTVVSTELLDKICQSYGAHIERVLTGFKYIGEKIQLWQEQGTLHFLLGAEESYGYLYGTHARDKDGIVSSCLVAEIALHAKKCGKTLIDLLEDLYHKHGAFQEGQRSVSFPPSIEGKQQQETIMQCLREENSSSFAGRILEKKEDFLHTEITKLPKTDMLVFILAGGEKLIIRPSGTESKIKIYGFVREQSIEEGQKKLALLLNDAEKELLQRGSARA